MNKNYGLVIKPIEEGNYVLGGFASLPKIVLQDNGQWGDYLPTYEPQYNSYFDSYGCSVWGTQNIIETILKKIEGKEYNFSERYTYNLIPISPPGTDPHLVAEVIRASGLVDEEVLPMTEREFDFITPRPMTQKYVDIGAKFGYIVKHEYVWNGSISEKERTEKIRECLRYSPLGVSVSAWHLKDGVYVDAGQPNCHWCELYGEDEAGWLIFDSYDQSHKILSRDHNIQICKRYMLVKKEVVVDNWLQDLLKQMYNFIKDILTLKRG